MIILVEAFIIFAYAYVFRFFTIISNGSSKNSRTRKQTVFTEKQFLFTLNAYHYSIKRNSWLICFPHVISRCDFHIQANLHVLSYNWLTLDIPKIFRIHFLLSGKRSQALILALSAAEENLYKCRWEKRLSHQSFLEYSGTFAIVRAIKHAYDRFSASLLRFNKIRVGVF